MSTIIFDLDDTLIDTAQIRRDRTDIFVRKFGVKPSDVVAAYARIHIGLITFEKLVHEHIKEPAARKAAIRALRSLFVKPKKYNYPGVEQMLGRLSRNHTLLLVTRGSKKFQPVKIRQSCLAKFFKRIIVVEDFTKRHVFAKLAKKYGRQTLLIDDLPEACAAAREAGMKAIRIKKGFKDAAYFRRLERRIVSIKNG